MDGRRQWNVETKALMADKFYFVAVEYLVKTDCGFHYPAELGWVEYSILEGISHFDNYFIPDVKIPDGSLADAQVHIIVVAE